MKETPQPVNKENHLKNLHGTQGVEGLTGRWKGTYYENGAPRLPIEKTLSKGGVVYERVRPLRS